MADGPATSGPATSGPATGGSTTGDPVAGGEVEALRALAHPVRWGILRRLAAEPGICACDFTEFFDVSQPTISAHLKVLREAGLVTADRNGTTICYRIAPGRLGHLGQEIARIAATVDPASTLAP